MVARDLSAKDLERDEPVKSGLFALSLRKPKRIKHSEMNFEKLVLVVAAQLGSMC